MKMLDIPDIFKSDAEHILKCRSDALRIHPTDIRAAGNEVETSVRDYFSRMLPPKYYVTHGHLIDINGNVSSQLDVIIADNSNLPSLMKTNDGTEYIPIDSVYAIGEIKSTYSKYKKPIQSFSDSIEDVKTRLFHDEIENTAYGGEITDNSTLQDMVLGKNNRILNRIFAFCLFVDTGDFEFSEIAQWFVDRDQRFLPNVTVLLNKGAIIWASISNDRFEYVRDPQETNTGFEEWLFTPQIGDGTGSLEGNHLGLLYYMVIEHLNNSRLEPPALAKYLKRMLIGRKSMLIKAMDVAKD